MIFDIKSTGQVFSAKTGIYWPNMTVDMKEEAIKNFITLNATHLLDIPTELTNIVSYRASLGHKVNTQITLTKNTNGEIK